MVPTGYNRPEKNWDSQILLNLNTTLIFFRANIPKAIFFLCIPLMGSYMAIKDIKEYSDQNMGSFCAAPSSTLKRWHRNTCINKCKLWLGSSRAFPWAEEYLPMDRNFVASTLLLQPGITSHALLGDQGVTRNSILGTWLTEEGGSTGESYSPEMEILPMWNEALDPPVCSKCAISSIINPSRNTFFSPASSYSVWPMTECSNIKKTWKLLIVDKK